MADAKEKTQALLSSTVVNVATTATKLTLYTVPAGKSCVVTRIVVRSPSASCANLTSVGFGFDTTCTNWKTSLSLANLTTVTTGFLTVDLTTVTQAIIGTAASVFGFYITTSTATGTATVDVFGYLF